MPRIEEIILPEEIATDYEAEAPFNSLNGIKRLNAFVGPNNAGKSRLLRELFLAGTNLLVSTDDEDARMVRTSVREALLLTSRLSHHRGLPEKVQELLNSQSYGFHPCGQHVGSRNQQDKKINELASEIQRYARSQPHGSDREAFLSASAALQSITRGLSKLTNKSQPQQRGGQERAPDPLFRAAEFIYIPTLRGMRLAIDDSSLKFAYFDRTWTDYVKGRKKQAHSRDENIEQARTQMSGKTIITGLDFYDVLTDRLLGSLADREFIREYQDYLSQTFFQDSPVALIPRRDHDTVNIKIGNEKERPIQSLGDGLQQLIILTLPIFENRDTALFLFIEEPDLFLHPGFQRVLIDAIVADEDRDLYVFVTTHSSQFLDITVSEEDCSIFRCTKLPGIDDDVEHDPRFAVSNASAGDHELLKHIGVRPSSVMFANCTIWVEGITDRLYFGRYVELLLQTKGLNLIENLHYAFVEYGGGNITHWSFLDEDGIDVERLCARLFLISDKDEGKDERHDKLAGRLGARFVRLSVREAENLLTPEVIAQVIYDYEGEEIELNDFTQASYGKRYLGKFIDSKVLVDKTKSKRFKKLKTCYEDRSGTVKDKVEFCRRAIRHINHVSDLSDEAKDLAERICEFIVQENA